MGGLYGFFKRNPAVDTSGLLERMNTALTHQDWHSDESFAAGSAVCGRKGTFVTHFQPFVFDDGNQYLMIDGDIFGLGTGHPEFTNTLDEEIIAAVAEQIGRRGPEAIGDIDGDYNILHYDRRRDRLQIWTDRFGLRHLFYYDDANLTIFAPEIDAILQQPGIDRSRDLDSMSDILTLRTMVHNETLFEKIKLIPAASYLEIDGGGLRVHEHWRPDYREDRHDASYDDLLEEGYELWRNAIYKRLRGKSKLAIPLSGGLDSRLLVAFALQKTDDIYCFTHGDPGIDEHRIAEIVAKHLNLDYDLIPFNPDALADTIEENVRVKGGMVSQGGYMVELAKRFGDRFEVFLNGTFAMGMSFTTHFFREDEIGRPFATEDKVKRIISRMGGEQFGPTVQKQLRPDFRRELLERRGNSIRTALADFEFLSDSFHKEKDWFLIQTLKRREGVGIDTWRYYVNDVLPLADYDLLDFYLRLPTKYKVTREFHYEIIRRKFPDLARIEYQRTGVDLFTPEDPRILERKARARQFKYYLGRLSLGRIKLISKSTWLNEDIWYRKSRRLQDLTREILLDERTARRGYYNLDEIEKILRKEARGSRLFRGFINPLLEFELSCRIFFD